MNSVILVIPGRTGSYPSWVMSITRPQADDLIPSSKRGIFDAQPTLSFSDKDMIGTFQPHDNALVFTLRIGRYDMKRVLVD